MIETFSVNFKSQYDKTSQNNQNDYKKRLGIMAAGMAVGTSAALLYNRNKNLTKKKLWFRSVETGAAVGLLADLTGLILEIPANMKKTNIKVF